MSCRLLQNTVQRDNFMIYYSQGSIPSYKIVKKLNKRIADVIDFRSNPAGFHVVCCLYSIRSWDLGLAGQQILAHSFPCKIRTRLSISGPSFLSSVNIVLLTRKNVVSMLRDDFFTPATLFRSFGIWLPCTHFTHNLFMWTGYGKEQTVTFRSQVIGMTFIYV